MPDTTELRIPDIGDFEDVPVIEIPVAPGDEVAEGDTLVILESDEATLDVPAEKAGRIEALSVSVGDRVGKGSVIGTILAETVARPDAPREPEAQRPAEPAPADPAPASAAAPAPTQSAAPSGSGPAVHASPSVRKIAREMGVTIGDVTPSGPRGRITPEDLKRHVKDRLTAPARGTTAAATGDLRVDFAAFGPVERQPLGRIRRISGPSLARNAMVIPHVTNFDEADVTDTEAFRKAAKARSRPR